MVFKGIQFDEAKVEEFCRRHHVRRLALFGSILREDFRPDSDIDVLVDFQPAVRMSLFDLGGMLMELREMWGRDVDLRTPQDLSRFFRERVVREARDVYVG